MLYTLTSKVFDKVPHKRLLGKIESHSLGSRECLNRGLANKQKTTSGIKRGNIRLAEPEKWDTI